jgi:glutaredoxin
MENEKRGGGMMEITLYTLEMCNRCNEIKDELDKRGIRYQNINISNNDRLGDTLEDVYKCSSYPMVLKNNIMFLPYTSLPITPNIKIYNSIAELIQLLNK